MRQERRNGHATGMAGEYHVMEKLFRLGHLPTLTVGNAKSIDILVNTKRDNLYSVSVKSVTKGGKWGIGKVDYSEKINLIFVFLYYKNFENIHEIPTCYVIDAPTVEKIKEQWFDSFALYYSGNHPSGEKRSDIISEYKENWRIFY